MEFFLNFDKPHISEKVLNFLEININEEEARKNLARLTKGLKLQYKVIIICVLHVCDCTIILNSLSHL